MVCGQSCISGALWMCLMFVAVRRYDSVIPSYRNNRQLRWFCNSIIDPMSLTEATNLLWHPYIQCTDAHMLHMLKDTLLCVNTCSQWHTHRGQSDFIRETCGVTSWTQKYTILYMQLKWIYALPLLMVQTKSSFIKVKTRTSERMCVIESVCQQSQKL